MPRGTVVHTAGRSRGTAAVVAAAVLIALAWGTVAGATGYELSSQSATPWKGFTAWSTPTAATSPG